MVITTHQIIPENQDMTIKNEKVKENIAKIVSMEKNKTQEINSEKESDKKDKKGKE